MGSKNFIGIWEKSNILTVKLKDENKELIIKTLNSILKNTKYSIADKVEKLLKLAFLENQKDLVNTNSLKSLTKLNEFSIANDIGDFDGFIGINDDV